jgi:hypothetical protein
VLEEGAPTEATRGLPPASTRRRRAPLVAPAAAVVLLALLGAAVALALVTGNGDDQPAGQTVVTITRTKQGTTVVETQTVAPTVAEARSGRGSSGLSPEEAAA